MDTTANRAILLLVLPMLVVSCAVQPGPIPSPFPSSTPPSSIMPTSSPSPTASQPPTFTSIPTQSLTPSPSPTITLAPMRERIQGISFPSYREHQYSHPYTDWTLENVVKPMGPNWVAIHFACYQKTYRATEIYCDEGAPNPSDIEHVVQTAHNLGLRVFMEIMISLEEDPDHWAGDIGKSFNEEEWDRWFASYTDYITEYAALAEQLSIDMFSIGQEMTPTIHHDEEWRNVAGAVKEVYSGPILYSAVTTIGGNQSVGETWLDINWWDAVDYIGIHPYNIQMSTNNDPSLTTMVSNLDPVLDRLEGLSNQYNRPVIITELGYHSIDGACKGSTAVFEPDQRWIIDLQEQADCYEAIMSAYKERAWWKGIFWFEMTLERIYSTPNNTRMSPYLKPAENVVRKYYGAPPNPTPTAVPTPDPNRIVRDIYIDSLDDDWYNYPPKGNEAQISFHQNKISVKGNAIEVSLFPYNGLNFGHSGDITLNEYDWFEFDLYTREMSLWNGINYKPIRIVIEIKDKNYMNATPFSVEVTNSSYVEDGELEKGEWRHVRVPLSAFGPLLTKFEEFTIRNLSVGEIQLVVDNVVLSK